MSHAHVAQSESVVNCIVVKKKKKIIIIHRHRNLKKQLSTENPGTKKNGIKDNLRI